MHRRADEPLHAGLGSRTVIALAERIEQPSPEWRWRWYPWWCQSKKAWQWARASSMQPKRSGKSGRYFMALNCASERPSKRRRSRQRNGRSRSRIRRSRCRNGRSRSPKYALGLGVGRRGELVAPLGAAAVGRQAASTCTSEPSSATSTSPARSMLPAGNSALTARPCESVVLIWASWRAAQSSETCAARLINTGARPRPPAMSLLSFSMGSWRVGRLMHDFCIRTSTYSQFRCQQETKSTFEQCLQPGPSRSRFQPGCGCTKESRPHSVARQSQRAPAQMRFLILVPVRSRAR